MLYKELVNFEPIESVVELKSANEKNAAMHLLDTYVISKNMAETISNIIINQLQFDKPVDNKGLLVVGNYGSGKSHLMSVISTIAEHSDSSSHIQNSEVAEKAKEIQGKFKVIRLELGATMQDLRGILTSELEMGLEGMGIDFTFPQADKITNNKDALEEMMGVFNEVYPDHGLLLVVDELLDYLRGRKEQEITLDLGFLREIGELAKNTRFRFISGIQERIFDNARFQFVAESLRRVKERFEQVHIVKEDIAFVIAERLLKKTPEQKALIKDHLMQFTKFYNGLAEKMEDYVNLFPVHPDYLTAFEKVHNIEKRVALRTITNEINEIIEKQIPENLPGIVSFDNYWKFIEKDPSNKTVPEVKEVMEKTATLKDRIQNALPASKKRYRDMAIRIINGLALDRLSTDDIYSKVGLTSAELRDGLFLVSPTMELLLDDDDPSGFLQSDIEVAMKAIMETVNFQFISFNETNGQYYLDLKKDIDIDSQIANQADLIENDKLDYYYFDLIKQAITLDDSTYVTGYKIWRHELPWHFAKVMRQGYLFLGSPNERSTAQPERDFYIYILRPYDKVAFKDEQRKDEIFFELNTSDDRFETLLRKYAAALELQQLAAKGTRILYSNAIDRYRKQLNTWLTENFVNVFNITYLGKKGHLVDLGVFLTNGTDGPIKETVNDIASEFLGDWFNEKYAEYPHFNKVQQGYLSSNNIKEYCYDALQQINGRSTKNGLAILDGLVLLNERQQLDVERSGRARWLMDLLKEKGRGKVLNNKDIFDTNAVRGVSDRRMSKEFGLEPELVVVLIAALVFTGKIEVQIAGEMYTATNYPKLTIVNMETLTNFTFIKEAADLPADEINALFKVFEVDIANFTDLVLSNGIKQTITAASNNVTEVLKMIQELRKGFEIAGRKVIDSAAQETYIKELNSFKNFAESLQRFDTPAKIKNLPFTIEDINEQRVNKSRLEQLMTLKTEIDDLTSLVTYATTAKYSVGSNSDWFKKVDITLNDLINKLSQGDDYRLEKLLLRELKEEYINYYLSEHDKSRLSATENKKRRDLLNSIEANILTTLASRIDMLPQERLNTWKKNLMQLTECYSLTRVKLETFPVCEHCQFNLQTSSRNDKQKLLNLEEDISVIYSEWIEVLLNSLREEHVQEQMALLDDIEKSLLDNFVKRRDFDFPLNTKLIDTIDDLLKGFEKVEITTTDIVKILGNGKPMTAKELEMRYADFMQRLLVGKDKNQVRITYKGD